MHFLIMLCTAIIILLSLETIKSFATDRLFYFFNQQFLLSHHIPPSAKKNPSARVAEGFTNIRLDGA